MVQKEIRTCKKHGETTFGLYSNGGRKRWRCLKCQSEAVQKRRDKTKFIALAYKRNKCQCCGYQKFRGALEFHHVDPTEKDFGISQDGYTRSWEKVKEELDKCVLVCSNCHREIHEGITKCPELIEGNDEAVKKAELQFEEQYNI